jgi:hypothetical protein
MKYKNNGSNSSINKTSDEDHTSKTTTDNNNIGDEAQ